MIYKNMDEIENDNYDENMIDGGSLTQMVFDKNQLSLLRTILKITSDFFDDKTIDSSLGLIKDIFKDDENVEIVINHMSDITKFFSNNLRDILDFIDELNVKNKDKEIIKTMLDIEFDINNLDNLEKIADNIYDNLKFNEINNKISSNNITANLSGFMLCKINDKIKELQKLFQIFFPNIKTIIDVDNISEQKNTYNNFKSYIKEKIPDKIKKVFTYKKGEVNNDMKNFLDLIFKMATSVMTKMAPDEISNISKKNDEKKTVEIISEHAIKEEDKIKDNKNAKIVTEEPSKFKIFLSKLKNDIFKTGKSLLPLLETIGKLIKFGTLKAKKIAIKIILKYMSLIKNNIDDIVISINELFIIFIYMLYLRNKIYNNISNDNINKVNEYCMKYNKKKGGINEIEKIKEKDKEEKDDEEKDDEEKDEEEKDEENEEEKDDENEEEEKDEKDDDNEEKKDDDDEEKKDDDDEEKKDEDKKEKDDEDEEKKFINKLDELNINYDEKNKNISNTNENKNDLNKNISNINENKKDLNKNINENKENLNKNISNTNENKIDLNKNISNTNENKENLNKNIVTYTKTEIINKINETYNKNKLNKNIVTQSDKSLIIEKQPNDVIIQKEKSTIIESNDNLLNEINLISKDDNETDDKYDFYVPK